MAALPAPAQDRSIAKYRIRGTVPGAVGVRADGATRSATPTEVGGGGSARAPRQGSTRVGSRSQ